MQILKVQADNAEVRFTKSELLILNNVMNEVCNGIEVPEFATRLGADVGQVRKLLGQVNQLLGHHLN